MPTIDKELNKRILDSRHALALTQIKFAEGLKLNPGYLASIELGNRPVNDRIIKLISMAYGVNEEWLKTGAGTMFDKIEDFKLEQIIHNFKKLDGLLQDYLLKQLDLLLEYQEKNRRIPPCKP
ncbi:MAG: helix-turn-helix transcriptional regulator [Spirochaetaceae bacterium]|jgi:transcriptional regulator with XRE-family HTH domain|nr:helix-turn-helix transcriptional regulator [Spirochaetaceae bacterium]